MPPPGRRDLLRPGLAAAADRRHAAGHRLDVGDAERLVDARQHEHRAAPRLRDRLAVAAAAPRKRTRSREPELARERARAPAAPARRRPPSSAAPGDAAASARSTSAWRLRATRWATVTSPVALAAGASGRSVPRCTTRVVARAERGGAGSPSRRSWRARAGRRASEAGRRGGRAPPRGTREHVAAVDGDDGRHAGAARAAPRRRPARRSGRARGRTGTRGAAAAARARASAPPTRPRRRSCAGAAARGTARSVTSIPSSSAAQRLAQRRGQRAQVARAQRGLRGHRAVQDEHAHVGAGVARRERLPVRPHAQHRVRGARVVLGDDRDPHHSDRCSASVSPACSRVT